VASRQPVAVDTCVLLNLLAAAQPLAAFESAAGMRFMIVKQVEREVIWLDPEEPGNPREMISIEPYVVSGDIQRLVLSDHEFARFVALARELDDGEAATLALAESRQLAVATDDLKARRIITTLSPQPDVIGTVAIVRAWATTVNDEEVRRCIRLIERRASFTPRMSDPDYVWWRKART
jgi:predicted nucleic acid-binding protein